MHPPASASGPVRLASVVGRGRPGLDAFRAWKPGQKSKNNGVILFIFVQDRKIRIETGLGLEHELPNSLCKTIISDQIGPRFKAGDYNGGLNAAIDSIVTATRYAYSGTGKTVTE